jgi:hypothetical protein
MARGWTMGVCSNVWNPWERWGQVYYPDIKFCQKLPSVCGQLFITHKFSLAVKVFYHKKRPLSGHIKTKKIVPMPFGAWRDHRALIFLPWSPFLVKFFLLHYKGCKSLPS